jgi:hypothetical protein
VWMGASTPSDSSSDRERALKSRNPSNRVRKALSMWSGFAARTSLPAGVISYHPRRVEPTRPACFSYDNAQPVLERITGAFPLGSNCARSASVSAK